jgi:hypothetical protein
MSLSITKDIDETITKDIDSNLSNILEIKIQKNIIDILGLEVVSQNIIIGILVDKH